MLTKIMAPCALTLAGLSALPASALAAEFNLFLKCQGQAQVGGKNKPATLDLAMRDNNQTALIQRSNVLPVGERLKYQASPMSYTLLYKLPQPGTHYYQDWVNGAWVVWQPNLKRLATIRLAIDRQTGELEGEFLDFNDDLLGKLALDCTPTSKDDAPEPKF